MDDSHTPNRAHADAARRIHDLRDQLQNLAETNPLPDRSGVNGWPRVFGSNGHRWISHPVSRDSIDELCLYLGTRLPTEFEEFLHVIGSGAGPHYGIFSPAQIREEVQLDRDDCAADQIDPPRSEHPFPITAAHVRDELAPVRPYPLDGAVRFCHRGCGNWTVLAITGELAGTVWDVDCHGGDWNDRADWWPASYPGHEQLDGQPVRFLDWYEHWLTLNDKRITK